MDFKSHIYSLDKRELEKTYQTFDSIGSDRPTDLNTKSIYFILSKLNKDSKTVLDVGAGRGYFLKKVHEKGYQVSGCDLMDSFKLDFGKYYQADMENLPFSDNQFDIVTCNHTLEHVVNIKKAVSEIKRVAKKQLIITVPCQKYFYYTLDLHIHFFQKKEMLENLVNLDKFECKKIHGDFVYVGYLS